MKIALVFLLAISCVFCTQVSSDDSDDVFKSYKTHFGIVDKLEQLVEEIVKKFKENIDHAVNKMKQVIAVTIAQINAILEKVKNELLSEYKKLDIQIEKLKEKGGKHKECAEKIELELNAVKNSTDNELEKCEVKAIEELKKYEESIDKDIKKVEELIEELRLDIVKCIHLNPVETFKCALKKIEDYSEKIGMIVKTIVETASNATTNAKNALDNVQKCNSNAVEVAQSQLEKISVDLQLCSNSTILFL